jgi:hypothetical protein
LRAIDLERSRTLIPRSNSGTIVQVERRCNKPVGAEKEDEDKVIYGGENYSPIAAHDEQKTPLRGAKPGWNSPRKLRWPLRSLSSQRILLSNFGLELLFRMIGLCLL